MNSSSPKSIPEKLLQEEDNEHDFIEKILQNPTPDSLSLDEDVKETTKNHWIDLCLVDSNPTPIKTIEFRLKTALKFNPSLSVHQEEELCNMLREHLDAFAWNYNEIKRVHPSVCTHHIYIKEGCKPVCQPQRRMNPTLKDIVKE